MKQVQKYQTSQILIRTLQRKNNNGYTIPKLSIFSKNYKQTTIQQRVVFDD